MSLAGRVYQRACTGDPAVERLHAGNPKGTLDERIDPGEMGAWAWA